MYSPGNALVVYEMHMHVLPTLSSPTITNYHRAPHRPATVPAPDPASTCSTNRSHSVQSRTHRNGIVPVFQHPHPTSNIQLQQIVLVHTLMLCAAIAPYYYCDLCRK